MSTPERFQPGDRIHDFEVVARLGSGTYGTVYACNWDFDDRRYAVKVLSGPISEARREFQALQGLRHRNIVGCLHAGKIEHGGWYLQCELVEGDSLGVRVRSGIPTPVNEAIDIGEQLLAGLEAIHPNIDRIQELSSLAELSSDEYDELSRLQSEGIVHRDVKPENIIQAPDGRVVLVDFGIASQSGSAIDTQSATPGYLPPDFTYLPGDRWSPAVDLYAAGVVLYELLCGSHPHEGVAFGAGPKAPPSSLPRPLSEWLLRACANSQESRFSSAGEMRVALVAAGRSPFGIAPAEPAMSTPRSGRDAVRADLAVEAYSEWPTRPVDWSSDDALEVAVVEIVAAEGPIVCGRLYSTLADAAGVEASSMRARLNQLVYGMVKRRVISQIEPPGQGQVDKTVHLGRLDRVRDLGPRTPWEYPKVELLALVRRILAEVEDADDCAVDFFDDPRLAASVVNEALDLDCEAWEARYFEGRVEEALTLLAAERPSPRVPARPQPVEDQGIDVPEIVAHLDQVVARIHRRLHDAAIPDQLVVPVADVRSLWEDAWDQLIDWAAEATQEQVDMVGMMDVLEGESIDGYLHDPTAVLGALESLRQQLWTVFA